MFYSVIRWFTALEALVLIGWAIAVLQEAARFRPPNVYVRLVTASYILLVVSSALHAIVSPHEEPHVFALIRVFALTFGLGAMYFMWRYYRYAERVKRHGLKSEEAARNLRESVGQSPD